MTGSRFTPLSRRSVLAGAAATAVGARLAAPALAQTQNTDRIIFAMSQEPVQFNPLLYVNTGTENVPESCLFDALWDVADSGEFIPNLAAEIPTRANGGISADGLIWRIHLKRDVKWSDGQPLTAKDVAFTYETIMNPKVAVRSRSGFDLIKTLKIVDENTVDIESVRALHVGVAEHAYRARASIAGRGRHQYLRLQLGTGRHRPLPAEKPRRRQPHDL
jgi:peptide/nickel transport system substrate-binding protein